MYTCVLSYESKLAIITPSWFLLYSISNLLYASLLLQFLLHLYLIGSNCTSLFSRWYNGRRTACCDRSLRDRASRQARLILESVGEISQNVSWMMNYIKRSLDPSHSSCTALSFRPLSTDLSYTRYVEVANGDSGRSRTANRWRFFSRKYECNSREYVGMTILCRCSWIV